MNNSRRKEFVGLTVRIQNILDELETIMDDEEEYCEYMPENLHGSERYEASEEASTAMAFAKDGLGPAIEIIEEII